MKWFTLIFFAFITIGFAQSPNWTSVKETNINVSSANTVDIFTNRDGNHIIVQDGNYLKYYRMNLNGVAGSAVNLESNVSVISPSITGNDTKIYVVYRKNNESYIRTKYSTNGGVNWYYLTANPTNSNATSIESEYSNTNLHVTYQVSNVIYYTRYNGTSWSAPVIVSIGESGVNPRITARYSGINNDYVFFTWQKSGTNEFNHRRYEVTTNTWGDKLPGYTVSVPNLVSSNLAGLRVTESTIIIYFSYYENGSYNYHFNWVWRDLNYNTLLGTGSPTLTEPHTVYSTTTFDNISHSAYYYVMIAGGEGGEQSPLAIWRSKSLNGYPDDIIYEYQDFLQYEPMFTNLSSAGNEVHVIWKDEFGNNNGNNLRYRWDNQNPIAPQNLTLINNSGHPRLQWPKNPEPDIYEYMIYRDLSNGLGFQYLASTSNTLYDDPTVTINPPGGPAGHGVYYKITASDITDYESDYSNIVSCNVPGNDPYKSVSGNSFTDDIDYKLIQNYPNPFNPSTLISYQLKEKGFVSLKVYDMLGREVASLVNENQESGNYSVTFNAAGLPSGVYIYSLRVNDFVQNNKMTLMK